MEARGAVGALTPVRGARGGVEAALGEAAGLARLLAAARGAAERARGAERALEASRAEAREALLDGEHRALQLEDCRGELQLAQSSAQKAERDFQREREARVQLQGEAQHAQAALRGRLRALVDGGEAQARAEVAGAAMQAQRRAFEGSLRPLLLGLVFRLWHTATLWRKKVFIYRRTELRGAYLRPLLKAALRSWHSLVESGEVHASCLLGRSKRIEGEAEVAMLKRLLQTKISQAEKQGQCLKKQVYTSIRLQKIHLGVGRVFALWAGHCRHMRSEGRRLLGLFQRKRLRKVLWVWHVLADDPRATSLAAHEGFIRRCDQESWLLAWRLAVARSQLQAAEERSLELTTAMRTGTAASAEELGRQAAAHAQAVQQYQQNMRDMERQVTSAREAKADAERELAWTSELVRDREDAAADAAPAGAGIDVRRADRVAELEKAFEALLAERDVLSREAAARDGGTTGASGEVEVQFRAADSDFYEPATCTLSRAESRVTIGSAEPARHPLAIVSGLNLLSWSLEDDKLVLQIQGLSGGAVDLALAAPAQHLFDVLACLMSVQSWPGRCQSKGAVLTDGVAGTLADGTVFIEQQEFDGILRAKAALEAEREDLKKQLNSSLAVLKSKRQECQDLRCELDQTAELLRREAGTRARVEEIERGFGELSADLKGTWSTYQSEHTPLVSALQEKNNLLAEMTRAEAAQSKAMNSSMAEVTAENLHLRAELEALKQAMLAGDLPAVAQGRT